MKTFSTVIATLLLGAALTVPLGAQLNIAAEGVSDPSVLGETVVFDSDGVGQRVTKRLFLQFDPGGERSLTLRQVRVIGSSEFTYELKGVSRLPAVIRGELEVDLFTSYHPSGPGPAQAVLELTLRIGDSDTDPTLTVYTVNLVGRVPSYTLSYVLLGGARRGVPVAGLVDFGHKPTGTPTEATLVLTNDGSGPGTVRGVRVSGTSAYSLVSPPAFPVRLEPGRALSIQLAFQPTSTSVYRGQVTFDFGVLDSQYVVAGVGGDLLKFRVISYAHDSSTGRSADVQSGSPIVFGQSAARVDVVGLNTRQNAQLVDAISVSGPFQMSSGPALPKSLAPGESFAIRLEPSATAGGDLTGILVIGDAIFPLAVDIPTLPGVRFSAAGRTLRAGEQVSLGLRLGRTYPVDISGTLQLDLESVDSASDPSLRWSTGGQQVAFRIPAGATSAVIAGEAEMVAFHAALVPGTITVTARLAAYPWGIDITPASAPQVQFTVEIAELPAVTFSREGGTVGAGQQIELGLSLAAAYPEAVAGTLQLTFEGKDVGSGMGPWAGGGQLVRFRIAAGEMGAMFADGFPTTQFRVPVEEGKVSVTARFATEDGGADITPDTEPELQFAVEIADLPEVRFSHAGGTVASAEQVDVGLSLAAAYPTDVVGVLALAFVTRAFANDPAIQWATGGHQATFQIPAGATDAVFSGNFAANTFQTGTVAGEIVVTARFFSVPDGIANAPRDAEAQAGAGVEITPDTALELRFIVMEGAPVLSRVALDSTGQGRFSLQVTGYSTAREVNSLSFAFTGTAGSNLQTPALEADVSQNFRTYYAGSQSTSYGSQFTATVDFMLDEGVFEDLEGASVTAANGSGQSNSVSVSLN
jgi:hypothetical protein